MQLCSDKKNKAIILTFSIIEDYDEYIYNPYLKSRSKNYVDFGHLLVAIHYCLALFHHLILFSFSLELSPGSIINLLVQTHCFIFRLSEHSKVNFFEPLRN